MPVYMRRPHDSSDTLSNMDQMAARGWWMHVTTVWPCSSDMRFM